MKAFFLAVLAASLFPLAALAQQSADQAAPSASPVPISTFSSIFTVQKYEVKVARKATAWVQGDIYFTLDVATVSPAGEARGTVWIDNPDVREGCKGILPFRTVNRPNGSTLIEATDGKGCDWKWIVKRSSESNIEGLSGNRIVKITKKE